MHSKVSVCMNSDQQKKRTLAKEKMPWSSPWRWNKP